MLPHSSDEVVEAGERAAAGNPESRTANERYADLARAFHPTSLTARSGLRALLDEIDSETGLAPPQPETIRGRFGQSVIRLQSQALWWLVRALRLRDKALRLTEDVISEMEQEIAALRTRVDELERKARERDGA